MNIHEYQAKEVLRAYGAPTPRGFPAFSVEEAIAAAKKLPGPVWVVKAQIHAGGRGKGGGVKVVRSIDDVKREAERMLGMTLVTHQTGPHGRVVRRLYIEEGSDIAEVAKKTPEKIQTFRIDPAAGYSAHTGRAIAAALNLSGDSAKQIGAIIGSLNNAFLDKDMSLLEINPLVITKAGQVICLDAKVNFDDNALYRHADIQALRDPDEEDPTEREAAKFDLNYIKLDGSIGCMVNGAGLAMATMDIIKLYGSEP